MNNESPAPKEESQTQQPEENTSISYGERMNIPLEYHLGEQQLLMLLMVPDSIRPYVMERSDPLQNSGIEDGLFIRWHEKYSDLFRKFCNALDPKIDEEREQIERIVSGRLTSDDYMKIRKYLEDPVRAKKEEGVGGPFFADDNEEKEFLKQFVL